MVIGPAFVAQDDSGLFTAVSKSLQQYSTLIQYTVSDSLDVS